MPQTSIQLFGRFCVRRNEQVVAGFETHKTQELFGYLLLNRHKPVAREHLIE